MTSKPRKLAAHRQDSRGRAAGYRSGLEEAVAKQLEEAGIEFEYEGYPLHYTVPERVTRYTVDFLLPNGILIETKGRFTSDDRKKHKLIKEQHPDLDIRIVFSNPKTKIGKKSQTTYAMWCERVGIPYAAKWVPDEWINEPPTEAGMNAAKRILKWEP